MVISNLNTKLIQDRLGFIVSCVERLHFYHEMTDEELYTILTNNLPDIRMFIQEMGAFLEAYNAFKRNNHLP